MLVIRLSRHGRKKRPTYRLVLQEREWAPSSKAIENLGTMNPHTDPATIVLKEDRITYWLGQGAQPSNTVHNMLVTAGLIKADKKRSVFGKKEQTEEELAAEKAAAEKKPEVKPEEKSEDSAEPAPVETPAEQPKEAPAEAEQK